MSLKTLIIKDLKIVFSDKRAFVLLVAMPIILFTILSFALGGSFESDDGGVWDISIAIVKDYDLDKDYEMVKDYIEKEDAMALESILYDIFDSEALDFIHYDVMDYDLAVDKLEAGELASIIILPEHYVSDLMMNMSPTFRRPIDIEIIKNVDMSYSADIVANIVDEMTVQLSQMMISNKVTYEILSTYNVEKKVIDEVAKKMQTAQEDMPELKMTVNDIQIDRLKMITSSQYYSTAMMAMFLLFGASYGAKFMLDEKKKFTLQRQTVAGLSSRKIVFGKMILIFCIAILQISLMMLTSIIGFKVYWGNPLYVVLYTFLVAFAVTGFGCILAAIALKMDNLKALNMMESGVFQIIALFGGSYFPLYLMPKWFQSTSKVLLNGASLDGYQKLMMNAPLGEMVPAIVSLTINGLLFMGVGLLIMHAQSFRTLLPQSEVS